MLRHIEMGQGIIRFWIKNGCMPIYLSPRYNKVAGEKNLAVVKPLSRRAEEIAINAYRSFTYYLSKIAHILYSNREDQGNLGTQV